jgi:glutaconyl-CoA/methylmalonyl-CoA decarboxylase subunit gamma
MKYCVTINNKRYEVEVEKGEAAILSKAEIAPKVIEEINPAQTQIVATAQASKVVEKEQQTTEAALALGREVVKSPMPGVILDIKVSVGSAVKEGDTLLMLEAMKMENEITAHVDGIVAEVRVSKGTNVSTDEVLVVLR